MTRIALQAFLIVLPLLLYLLYSLFSEAERKTPRKGISAVLLLVGFLISAAVYVVIFLTTPRGERTCYAPTHFENGELVQGEVIPCDDPDRATIFEGEQPPGTPYSEDGN